MTVDGLPAAAAPGKSDFSTRRTFAIISHPDAGKTTLTEKLLLQSGSIRLAGEVKARGDRRRTRSDWMEIEQKRGISISSSVMTFDYDGLTLNLLDTPGHADFSEDTFRTLTAVDSAIMVIDAAKGIESQTWKLFEVCRMRDIPIMTFVNKVDREGDEPLSLLDEIMDRLALEAVPMSWPIGLGVDFRGVLNLAADTFMDSTGHSLHPASQKLAQMTTIDGSLPRRVVEPSLESLEIAKTSLPIFDPEEFRRGSLTPVFFGSALKNIGVDGLLTALARFAPCPRPQPADPAEILPEEPGVSGFVFKVQANMDPNHRDRVAFLRICSGKFQRGMQLRNARSGRDLKISNPMFFFARDRELAEEAVAGDIVGVPNHGTLSVGDTLSAEGSLTVQGIPNFAPEVIRRVRITDTAKMKQLSKALSDLAEEGVIQLFRPVVGSGWHVGAVGVLQFDVLTSRAAVEYGVNIKLEDCTYETARWPVAFNEDVMDRFLKNERMAIFEDADGNFVYFARSRWDLDRTAKDWPHISFLTTRERGGQSASR